MKKEHGKEHPKEVPELLKTAIDTAMTRLLGKITSREGLKTDYETYRTEVHGVLDEMGRKNPEIKDMIEAIKDNYLNQENGAKNIQNIIEIGQKVLDNKKTMELGPKEFDSGMLFLRSSMGLIIDVVRKTPEKIPEFIEQMKKNEQTRKILERFPDIENLMTKTLPELAKTVDKARFLDEFAVFTRQIREDSLKLLSGKASGESEQKAIALNIANRSALFTKTLLDEEVINKKTVGVAMDSLANTQAMQSNPIARPLFSLIGRKELSDDDRLQLVSKANDGLILLTRTPSPNEKELESYLNSVLKLLTDFASKLPKDLVAEKVTQIMSALRFQEVKSTLLSFIEWTDLPVADRNKVVLKINQGYSLLKVDANPSDAEIKAFIESTTSLMSTLGVDVSEKGKNVPEKLSRLFASNLKIRSGMDFLDLVKNDPEFAKALRENIWKLPEALWMKIRWKNTKEIIAFVLGEEIISKNLKYTQWHLVERLKSVVNLNLSTLADWARGEIGKNIGTKKPEMKDIVPKTGDVLGDKIAQNLSGDILTLFFSPDRPRTITQDVLVDKSIGSIKKTIASLPGESVDLRDKTGQTIATIPKSALLAMLENSAFREFLKGSFSGISQESMKNGDFMKNISKIVDEIKKDPLGNKYTGGEKIQKAAIDSFYSLPPAELAKTIHGNLEISGLGDTIKDANGTLVFNRDDIQTIIETLRENVPKNIVEAALRENRKQPLDMKNIILDIFKALPKENLKEIITRLGEKNIVSKLRDIAPKSWWELTSGTMNELIDMLYLAGEKLDPETRANILAKFSVDPKMAEVGLAFLKSLGKERAKELSTKHLTLINELLSGKTKPLEEPGKLASLATDIIYAFDASEIRRIGDRLQSVFPALQGFLRMEIGGENIISQIDKLRSAIPKASMQAFLEKNTSILVRVAETRDTSLLAGPGAEFISLVPADRVKSLFQSNKLSDTERFAVENFSHIQDIVGKMRTEQKERFDTITRLSSLAMKGQISEADAKTLGGEIYELIGAFVSRLWNDWKIPEWKGESSRLTEKLKSDFIKNNLGFILSQALPYLFGRSNEAIVSKYFTDASNKENFTKMILPSIRNQA